MRPSFYVDILLLFIDIVLTSIDILTDWSAIRPICRKIEKKLCFSMF